MSFFLPCEIRHDPLKLKGYLLHAAEKDNKKNHIRCERTENTHIDIVQKFWSKLVKSHNDHMCVKFNLINMMTRTIISLLGCCMLALHRIIWKYILLGFLP